MKTKGIREQVKKGELSPEAALAWLRGQEQVTPAIAGWLRRRIARQA